MANFRDLLNTATIANVASNEVATASMIATLEAPALTDIPAYEGVTLGLDDNIALADESWTRITDRYIWYDEFDDSRISIVDEMKNITLDSHQINLSQEELSQYILFEMPRRYDNFDLALNTRIQFHYVNGSGFEDYATAVNVHYSLDKIRFALLVPYNMTYLAGNVDMEIIATGTNSKGENYKWISRHTSFNVEKSLIGNGIINPTESDWYTQFVRDMDAKLLEAQSAKDEALAAAARVDDIAADVDYKISNVESIVETNVLATVEEKLLNHYTKEEVDTLFDGFDISDQLVEIENDIVEINNKIDNFDGLANLKIEYDASTYTLSFYNGENLIESVVLNSNPSSEWVTAYDAKVDTKISESLSPIKEDLDSYKETTNSDLHSIHENIDNLPTTLKEDYYDKEATDELLSGKADVSALTALSNAIGQLESIANTNKADISTINTAITDINEALSKIDTSPNVTYEAVYNDTTDENCGEYFFVLYEIKNEGKENEERTVKSRFQIIGGSGGSSSANTIKIERITSSPLVVTVDDDVIIEYKFTGTDSSGEDIGQGNATWRIGNRIVKTETIYTGDNSVDLTEFIGTGSDQKITLTISDEVGSSQQKIWYVSVVDVKITSTFDDTKYFVANTPVDFSYTPSGAVDKTVHFLMDGKEIGTVESKKAAAGLSTSYTIPAQSHGTHLFEVYMTANINNNNIESNHIVKDIIWYDSSLGKPIIGCVSQDFIAKQYETTSIVYTVYDPSTETPVVNLKSTYVNEDGEVVEEYNETSVMSSNTDTWKFKTDVIGEHTLTITCGDIVKTLKAKIEDIGIEVSPTTTGLEFDFDPVGRSNNNENRIWTDANTGVGMTVSDNFDWVNGGYQLDESGDQYFCVKSGTHAVINYNLFADDAKENGKEFKVIFKTTNVKKRDTSFISCMNGGIGLDMKVESANIYSSNDSLYSPYCEDDIIEFEFNINKNTDIPMVLTYEDGVGNRPMIYTSDSSFWQAEPQAITIGSDDCDVHIYRMKAYSTSLSDKDILNNFIADARSAEEMIARYKRNQIYKEGSLDPEYLAEVCPDLRIIMIDAPWFTNDKDNKVTDTNITMIYKNGDPVLDNWTCTGATHRGRTPCPMYMETCA